MVGTKLVLPGPRLDGGSLYELFEAEGVTVSAGVPTVWQGLLSYVDAGHLSFSTMRRTVIGGSACPPSLLQAFEDRYNVQVLHAWGMTEMSPLGTVAALKACHAGLPAAERQAIQRKQGRVLYPIEMKVVSADGRELPWDGTSSGELLVKGAWVAREYFREGPALRDGWFATGDVATIDPDGYMQITDRSKDVIKSRGGVDQFDRIGARRAVAPGRGQRRMHRSAPPQVGRASAAGGRLQIWSIGQPR